MTGETLLRQFKERVYVWSRKLEINVQALHVDVQPMNEWGSCSSNGKLTFSTELLDLGADLQDYVIVHELLHLHVANHGVLWKALMSAYLEDWQARERRLPSVR